MANSSIYSSKPPTPFHTAISVRPIPDTGNTEFEGEVPWDWCGAWAAHGGFLASLIYSTARTYFTLTRPFSAPLPDPINTHLQFLSPVARGRVHLAVTLLKPGSRISIISVTLVQPSRSSKPCILATIAQGCLASETGIGLPTSKIVKSRDVPDRETECVYQDVPDWVYSTAPCATKVQNWILKGREWEEEGRLSRSEKEGVGWNVRDYWKCLTFEEAGWDVLSLGSICDTFAPVPTNYSPNSRDFITGIEYPTLSITTEIKKDPKGAKWLYQKIRSHAIRNGRFDTECVVLDEEGDVVALTRHVSLIVLDRVGKKKGAELDVERLKRRVYKM